MGSRPDDVDERLWVIAGGYDGLLYLTHNPRTFHGRMGAWFPAEYVYVSLSVGEVNDSSVEAAAWMQGFLVGNEPRADEMFGPTILDAADDDPRWDQ